MSTNGLTICRHQSIYFYNALSHLTNLRLVLLFSLTELSTTGRMPSILSFLAMESKFKSHWNTCGSAT